MRLIDLLPFLGGVAYKQVQVQVATRTEEYFSGEYGTKQEQYVSGYGTKTEQYITGYQKKTVTEIQGEDPYYYNAYTNNKVGCTTNKYATAPSRTNQSSTGGTCKLINDDYVGVNDDFIWALNRCVGSSSDCKFYTTGGDLYAVLDGGGGASEDRAEYNSPIRQDYKTGVYNPKCTGATYVTRQVDDKSRPIYGTRTVTDYNKPIYGTRTVTDYNKPIYKTREVPVYEWQWVEE